MSDGWEPTRWWRVDASDGSLWCETSNEEEARRLMRAGDVLYKGWRREQFEWRICD